jgi:Ribonuclease G/E
MTQVRVRIRGIYATALSKLLLDHGFKIVEASEKIQERLSIELEKEPADVTVKTTDIEDEILVIGTPREAVEVYNTIVENLKYVFTWRSKLELYAVYKGVVTEKIGDHCTVDLGGIKGYLLPCTENQGSSVVVGVKKAPLKPGERTLLSKSFMIRGKVLALIHSEPRISFSEHIRDSKTRARLSSLALSKLMGTGLGVHFRSSSKYASDEIILEEISRLILEYRDLVERAKSLSAPVKLRDGEFIGIIGLTSLAKSTLDEIRSTVTRTISLHHSLKSSGLSDYVDLLEGVAASDTCSREVSLRILHFISEKLRERRVVEFIHIKPTGEKITLGEGEVLDVSVDSNLIKLVVKRTIKSPGVYDGLGVEKEPGDVDYVVVRSDQPILSHNYYRGEKWLGSYININTPPEVAPGLVKYNDLLVDVIVMPSGDVKVVDEKELDKAREAELVTEHLYSYAKSALKHVLENYTMYIYNPRYKS